MDHIKQSFRYKGKIYFELDDGKIYNSNRQLVEAYQGEYRVVINTTRVGWWRFHEHYDRDGYCDNPSRGY